MKDLEDLEMRRLWDGSVLRVFVAGLVLAREMLVGDEARETVAYHEENYISR